MTLRSLGAPPPPLPGCYRATALHAVYGDGGLLGVHASEVEAARFAGSMLAYFVEVRVVPFVEVEGAYAMRREAG